MLTISAKAKLTGLEWRFSQDFGGAPAGRPSSTTRSVGSVSISGGTSNRRGGMAIAVLKRVGRRHLVGTGHRKQVPRVRERTQIPVPTPRRVRKADRNMIHPGRKEAVKQVRGSGVCEHPPALQVEIARRPPPRATSGRHGLQRSSITQWLQRSVRPAYSMSASLSTSSKPAPRQSAFEAALVTPGKA